MNKNKKFEKRLPKTALNIVRDTGEGQFQVFQLYAGMMIPLLRTPARTVREAFDRLNQEYYM